jgi:hypothetical protein
MTDLRKSLGSSRFLLLRSLHLVLQQVGGRAIVNTHSKISSTACQAALSCILVSEQRLLPGQVAYNFLL